MQLLGGDHVAELAVFVGLAGLESLTTGHGDGVFEPGFKAGEVPQIRRCRDRDLAPQLLEFAVTVPRITTRLEG